MMINNDFIGIKLQSKYGFIDFNAKLRIANRYDSIGSFSENLAPIYLLNKWGYIDKIERIRIQPKYDFAGKFESQNAIVGRKGKYGIVTGRGKKF